MSRQCCCKPKKPQCCCMPAQQSCCMPAQQSCCIPIQPTCGMPMEVSCGENKSACSFPCLIILILILLQFGRGGRRSGCCDPCEESCEGNRFGGFGLDSGILFIIALYYLSCACPCG